MRRLSLFLLVAVVAYLTWFGGGSDHPAEAYAILPHHADYYNLLAEGMSQGHLWMNLPYDTSPGAVHGFVNDASLYHEHYYIYFGPTPVILLFLPFLELTGRELPPSLVVVFFVSVGFFCQAAVLLSFRRRHAARLPAWLEAGAILLVAFGASTPILTVVHQVYEVAVASAYCFMSLAWLCLFEAFHRPAIRARWLAGASLAVGLAVGCRPDCLLLLGAVGAAAGWFVREEKAPQAWLRLGLAAVLPAAVIGVLLAAYNVARFGRVGEFGQTYQANEMVSNHLSMMSPAFIPENFGRYLFRPPEFSPYFPYFLPIDTSTRPPGYFGYEIVHGHFFVLILALVIAAGLIAVRKKSPSLPDSLRRFLTVLGVTVLALLLFICAFGSSSDRYAVDFLGSLTLLLALAGLWTAVHLGRTGRLVFTLAAAAVVCDHVLFPFQNLLVLLPPHPSMAMIYRLGNYPSYWAEKAGFIHYGPRRLDVVWADRPKAVIEPLLSTGSSLGYDVLESVQDAPDTVRLRINLELAGSIISAPQPITPGQTHILEVDMGSFYPPRFHPYFDGWSRAEVDTVKTATRVLLDGREVIRTRLAYDDSPPGNLRAGVNPEGGGSRFSGRIVSFTRLPQRNPLHDPAFVESGLWRVRLEPNIKVVGLNLPVLSGGVYGAGNQLVLRTLAGQQVAFGIDTWGRTIDYAPPISTGPDFHLVEIFAGAEVLALHPALEKLLPKAAVATLQNQLTVWWDGKTVASFQLTAFQDCFALAALGANSQQFSSTPGVYSGGFDPRPYSDADGRAFIQRNLDALGLSLPAGSSW